MATAVKTTVTELPESRVRVEAEVPPDEVERARRAGRAAARPRPAHPRLPQGQGPAAGRHPAASAARPSSTRRSATRSAAGTSTRSTTPASRPVGDPDARPRRPARRGRAADVHDRDRRAPDGRARRVQGRRGRPPRARRSTTRPIDAEVDAAARARSRAWRPSRSAADERRLRRHGLRRARSTASRSRAARAATSCSSSARGRLIPGFEEQLTGATAGEERTVELTFPDDYGAEHLAGKDAVFEVTVKEVKRKQLPELDDDFAVEAAGFDSLDELREDIRKRLEEAEERADRGASSARPSLDAAVAEATVDVPDALVEARAQRAVGAACCTRSRTRASPRTPTCGSPARPRRSSLEEAKPDAEQALRREAVLAAIVEAEGIEVVRRRGARGARRPAPSASSVKPEEAARAAAQRGPARRASRRTSPRARRSTSSSSAPSRSPSSRRRRATSSGRRSRSRRSAAASSGRPASSARGPPGRSRPIGRLRPAQAAAGRIRADEAKRERGP